MNQLFSTRPKFFQRDPTFFGWNGPKLVKIQHDPTRPDATQLFLLKKIEYILLIEKVGSCRVVSGRVRFSLVSI